MDQFFNYLSEFENAMWGYVGVPALMVLGIYLCFQSRFIQITKFPLVLRTFFSFLTLHDEHKRGVHPLKAFFASLGGAVGVGNVVAICTAVQIGGPGALFWIWVTALTGMMLKYSEVFLGLKYRVPNNSGGYNGGPMYFLRHVFKKSWIPNFVALLLCIYGVEVYQFNVVVTSITSNIDFNEYVVSVVLLLFVLFAGSGGVRRVGNIASAAIPLFVILYVAMGFWVMAQNIHRFPEIFGLVLSSAFTGHAALGAFIGSPFLLTMSEGVRRGCYTGDVGVGYASVIHSESFVQIPEKQALLAIFDIFTDTIVICSTSIMLVLLTGVWHESIDTSLMVQTALSQYFPYMHFFMPFFLFILGYSTINAYFVVGLKCAGLLAPKIGPTLYYIYAIVALLLFSIIETRQAQLIMSIAGGLLLIINCYGIFRLRKEISYDFEFVEKSLEKNRVI